MNFLTKFQSKYSKSSQMAVSIYYPGTFNNYLNKKRWEDDQLNFYPYKLKDIFLFTLFVYERWGGAQKVQKYVYVVIECPL